MLSEIFFFAAVCALFATPVPLLLSNRKNESLCVTIATIFGVLGMTLLTLTVWIASVGK